MKSTSPIHRELVRRKGGGGFNPQLLVACLLAPGPPLFSHVREVISRRLRCASKGGCSTEKDVYLSTVRGSGVGCLAGFSSWLLRRSKSRQYIRGPYSLPH